MSTNTPTTTDANRQRIRQVMAELDKGNGKPFVDTMADDFSWTIPGDTPWSRTYSGKQVVIHELLRPLYAQFATPYVSTTHRVMADGDRVIIEFEGRVTTKAGKAYNNRYCYVCRMEDGQMKDLMEYLDTALVNSALEAPSSSSSAALAA
jgi:ketosteroid isomerase-like protein